MTDKLTPEQVANLAAKGTQGAWRYEGGRTVYAKARETLDGNKDGALAIIVTHHENDWFSEFDSQRIANVPAMEALIASQSAEIKLLREGLKEILDLEKIPYPEASPSWIKHVVSMVRDILKNSNQ